MSVSLVKGQNVNLTKQNAGLTKVKVTLNWPERLTTGASFDLDSQVFMLGENNKVRMDEDFIFFNNLSSKCKSVIHMGDNKTGHGDDDEIILIDLTRVPTDVKKIVFTASLYEAKQRNQNFGQVESARIDLFDAVTLSKEATFDLSEDASTDTAIIFGELYRNENDWKFKAVGQGFAGGLEELARNFGVNVG